MEEKVKSNKEVTRFVLTLGNTANQESSAMYYPMVIILIAQMKGIHVGLKQSIALW